MAALAELFDDTTLMVPCYPRVNDQGEIPLAGSRLRVLPLPPPYGSGLGRKLLFPLWCLRCAPAVLREFRNADAVHAPIPGDVGTVGMLLAWLFRTPLFIRYCGNWLTVKTTADSFWHWFIEQFAGGRNVMLATGGALEPPSVRNSNVHWIFSSSLTRAELESYACPRSYPPHHPSDEGRGGFHSVPERSVGRGWNASLPNPGDPVRLIIVGRQEAGKGTEILIKSLPLVFRQFPHACLDVVGDGSAVPMLKRLAAELGIEEKVAFHGKVNHAEVMRALQNAHVFCFPTQSEGFPKAVLEAMACGLPVVATKVSVLPQLLASGCGVLLDETTPEAVARGILKALNDPARFKAMSRAAIETARQYSLEAWRDTIGAMLEAAWGPLRTGKVNSRNQKSEISSQRI